MSPAKTAAACALAAVSLSACGVAAKPQAGSKQAQAASYQRVTDPRTKHLECLQQEKIPVREFFTHTHLQKLPSLQIEKRPAGPTVIFYATAGAAQNQQITGQAQGAEVIGAALLYPNQASDALLSKVESCVAKGVSG